MKVYKLNKNSTIPIVDQWNIRMSFEKLYASGVLYRHSFSSNYNKRTKMIGFSGTAFQSAFTVACAFSHRRIWQNIVDKNVSQALILENDAEKMFEINLTTVINRLTEIDSEWNFIQLGRCWDFCDSDTTYGRIDHLKIIKSDSPSCSHAYIISLEAAKVLLQYSLPHVTSVDLLFGILNRQKLLNMYSLSPPLYTQNRTQQDHDNTKLLECDTQNLRNVKYKDDSVLSIINNAYIKYFISSNFIPKYSKYNSKYNDFSCKKGKGKFSIPFQNIVFWKSGGHNNQNTNALFEHSIFTFSSHVCTSSSYIPSNSLIISFGNHFTNIPAFHVSNLYLFYGTMPLFYRNYPQNSIQWHIKLDKFHFIDSIDFFSHKKLETYWIPDKCLPNKTRKNTLLVSEDVNDKNFCSFTEKYSQYKITKLGYRHPKCKFPYTHIQSPVTRKTRLEEISQTEFYGNVSLDEYIGRDSMTSIYCKKKLINSVITPLPETISNVIIKFLQIMRKL